MKTLLFLLLALIPRDYYAEAEQQYYDSQYAQAIKTALEGTSQPGIADSTAVELWSILGASYSRLGAFDKAAEYMILCYEYDKKAGDAAGLTSSLINLASMYVYAGKGDLAEDYALEAVANEERIGRPAKLAMACGKACDVYHAIGKDSLALSYANRAVAIADKDLDPVAQAIRRSQRAYSLEALGRYEDARQDLLFAEKVFREADVPQSLAIVCFQLGQEYGRQGKRSLERKYLKESAEICRKLEDLPLLEKVCTQMAASLRTEDPAQALLYLEEAGSLQARIAKSKSDNALELFNIEYETARREKTIAEQRLRLLRQQSILLLVGLLAVGAAVAAARWRRSQRILRRSNEQKDFLFKVISHDIQSPAVAQLRGMQMLRSNAGKMSAEQLSEVFLQLERQAAGEVELIENVLRWARTQGVEQSVEGVPFVLGDLVKEVMAQYEGAAGIKDISLVLEAPERAVVVCSNRSNLMLALRNLLSNAVKFSPRGETVRIVITPSPDGASLAVVDKGIGIPADKLEGIFEADATFRRSGTDGEPSNGLGLAVSRKLLEEAGCSLSVESTEGKGSAFTIGIQNLEYNA